MVMLHVPLPPEMEPYKDDLEFFVQTMIRKLHSNRHKGVTKDLNVSALIGGIKRELVELEQAIDNEGQFDAPLEAADIANYSFLIAIAIWHMTRKDFEDLRARINEQKMAGKQ